MTLIFHDQIFFLTIPTVDLNHTPHLSGIHHGLGHQMFTTSCIECTAHGFACHHCIYDPVTDMTAKYFLSVVICFHIFDCEF